MTSLLFNFFTRYRISALEKLFGGHVVSFFNFLLACVFGLFLAFQTKRFFGFLIYVASFFDKK